MTMILTVIVVTFINVFIKGIQHKNVINNLYAYAWITSYVMAMFDVVVVGLIAKSVVIDNNWFIGLASGAGASFGMVTAMYVHNRFMSKGEINGNPKAAN